MTTRAFPAQRRSGTQDNLAERKRSVASRTALFYVVGETAELRLVDPSAVPPAGHYRIRVNNDTLYLERAGAADFTGTPIGALQFAGGTYLNTMSVAAQPLDLENTNNGASNKLLELRSKRSGSAVNDDEGLFDMGLKLSDAVSYVIGRFAWKGTDVTAAGFDSALELYNAVNAVLIRNLQLGSDGSNATFAVLGNSGVPKQTSGANLTNNVASGGTDDTIATFTDLATYANDAATIRNDIYQLARKLKQVNDALRLFGLLT